MARTTESKVRAVIATDADIDLTEMINVANVLTTRMDSNATAKGYTLSADELEVIETYLAAHFYALRDLQPIKEREGRSSIDYMGKTGYGLEATLWGQQALALDVSGSLGSFSGSQNVGNNNSVGLVWLGEEDG